MKIKNGFPGLLLLLALLAGLAGGFVTPGLVHETVNAAPLAANALDVVINEVAWGGTIANPGGEWIELYNSTNVAINLTNWKIVTTDGTPGPITIPSGIIPANGYFLLESGNDTAAPGIAADYIYSGTFSNSGEILSLFDNSSNLVDTANTSGGAWDAGSGSPTYYTMQRLSPLLPDSASAWTDSSGTPQNSQIDLELSIKMKNIVGTSPPVTATFTLTVSNKGYGSATSVDVTDNLPLSGLSFVSYSSSNGSTYDNNLGIWTVGSIPSGTDVTLDMTVVSNDSNKHGYSAQITNSDQSDPDNTNNSDSIQVGLPVLGITNTVNNSTPNVGTNVAFTITVSNPSGMDASNVVVDGLLPTGLKYISSSLGTYDSNTGLWNIGSLSSNNSVTLKITATVISNGLKTYVADVSSTQFANNSATAVVDPMAGDADLSLTQGPINVSGTVADQVVLPITIHNAGSYDATNVQVRDLLPSGLDFVSYTSTKGTYSSGTGIWSINSLALNADATLNITVKVAASGASTNNFAEVWQSDQFDPNSSPGNGSNGEDDNTSLEVPIVDLSLTESVDISSNIAIFTIKVNNSGPDDATGVKVKTSLPSLTSTYAFVSYGSSQGTYASGTGVWDVGSLADGGTETLVITTNVLGPLKANWVEVSASQQVDADSVPANNSKTEDDDASAPAADLYLNQSVNNTTPNLNSSVKFTITVGNLGPAGTTNVQVKDLLPASLTFQSSTSSQGSYASASGIWAVGALGSGSVATLDIFAKVEASGVTTNWAEVWKSDEADPDSTPGNNSTTEDDDASAVITVAAPTPSDTRAIIINEVAWAGTASSLTDDEWIELYNPGSKSINITGWRLRASDGSPNILLAGTIPAKGYFLLERGNDNVVKDIAADLIYPGGGTTNSLSNTGEALGLYDGSNKLIDTANANGSSWPKGSSTTYGTMERDGTGSESDYTWHTNNGIKRNGLNANDGKINGTPKNGNSAGPTPTPTRTPTNFRTATPSRTPTRLPPTQAPSITARLIINEIMARPDFDWNHDGKVDVYDEFIEIKNTTPIDVDLKGWKLDNGILTVADGRQSFDLPSNVTLKPGEHIAFYRGDTNLPLSDGGAFIRLLNPQSKVYDEFKYSIAKIVNRSFCRIPDGGYSVQAWFEDCTPTPNLTNTREGSAPSIVGGFESPVCDLPDTIPTDFLVAECRGYGANIWNSYYWDEFGWPNALPIPDNLSKWESFIK